MDAGPSFSGAITSSGMVYTWGANTMGQQGVGKPPEEQQAQQQQQPQEPQQEQELEQLRPTTNDNVTPTLLQHRRLDGRRCLQISCGGQHVLFLYTERAPGAALPAPAPVPAPVPAPAKKRKAEAGDGAGPSAAASADSAPADAAVPPAVKKVSL